MATNSRWINNHLVYYNGTEWLDILGPNAVKWREDFVALSVDDTTGDPTEYTTTVVEVGAGNSTIALTPLAGGAAIMTAAANENDGIQIQVANGEAFDFSAAYPFYFGVKFQAADVDQTDILFGVCIQDTTLLGGMTDGLYFRSADEAATVEFVLEKDSTETSNSVATLTDATDVTLEAYFDGTNIYAYVNGVQAASVAYTDTNFPDDELLTPSLAMLTGEAVANTVTVKWIRAFQILAA